MHTSTLMFIFMGFLVIYRSYGAIIATTDFLDCPFNQPYLYELKLSTHLQIVLAFKMRELLETPFHIGLQMVSSCLFPISVGYSKP